MNKLEDRLRSGLTAEAEAWQDPRSVAATPRTASHRYGVMLTSAAAAVVLLIGVLMMFSGSAGDAPVTGDGAQSSPTTMAISDAEPAPEWGDLVQEGFVEVGIDLDVALSYQDTSPYADLDVADKLMYLAVITSGVGDDILLTVGYESFSLANEAETWQRVSGLSSGEDSEFGALYLVEDDEQPAIFFLKPTGAISIFVEDPTLLEVTSVDVLRQLAIYLGSQIDVEGEDDALIQVEPFEAIPFSGDTWQFKVAEAATPGTGTYKVCYTFVAPGEITDDSGLGVSDCTEHAASTQTSEPPTYFVDLVRAFDTDTGVVFLVNLTAEPVNTVRFVGLNGDVLDATPYRMPGSGKQFAVVEVPESFKEFAIEFLSDTGALLQTANGEVVEVRVEPTTPTTVTNTAPQINLFVSNQSYADPQINITIEIDGEAVVNGSFDVGNQHDWHEFGVELGLGEHTMVVTSGTGVRKTATFTIEEDSPLFAVVAFWGAEEDLDPRFVITFTDTPPGFA